jgi:hypothetical protein
VNACQIRHEVSSFLLTSAVFQICDEEALAVFRREMGWRHVILGVVDSYTLTSRVQFPAQYRKADTNCFKHVKYRSTGVEGLHGN